ncbi:MAG: hypothetical protein ABW277_16540 [Longimicrobiaceae bacterium]
MATSLRLIFWGFVLVLVDVRLGTVDVLPDFAGYGMVAIGAGQLAAEAAAFRTARLVAWAMVAPGLLDAVVPLQAAPLAGIIEALGQAALLWYLLTGIADWTAAEGRPDLAAGARRRRAASVVLLAVVLGLRLLDSGGGASRDVAVVVVFLDLVLMGMVLQLIHRVRAELDPGAGVSRPAAYRPGG